MWMVVVLGALELAAAPMATATVMPAAPTYPALQDQDGDLGASGTTEVDDDPLAGAQSDADRPSQPPTGPAPDSGQAPTAQVAEQVPAQVRASRQAIEEGTQDIPVLAIHATRLLDFGDSVILANVLKGDQRSSVLGVLQALQTTTNVSLLPETIVLAASSDDVEITTLAKDNLVRLARSESSVNERLTKTLVSGSLPRDAQATILQVLGCSRDLGAVDTLMRYLSGPLAGSAGDALEELTGRSLGSDREAWTNFWKENAGVSRDVLLERSLRNERDAHLVTAARLQQEVIAARIRLMGQDVELLTAGLRDDYPAVRLASARGLRAHPNAEQAATAIPQLLARLGYSVQSNGEGNGGTNGHEYEDLDSGSGSLEPEHVVATTIVPGDEADREPDAEVRAELVSAIGVLGRGNHTVRDVLLEEVRSGEPAIAAVAARAFERQRGEPSVVVPLLDFLARAPADEQIVITVLQVVANNQPTGVLDRLERWLDMDQPALVRSAAVAAALACTELPEALDRVSNSVGSNEVLDVRYTLGQALGNRARELALDDAARPRITSLLSELLVDVDASVRAAAATSLGESGDPLAFTILDQRSRAEADGSVMVRILNAFGEIGEIEGVAAVGRVCSTWSGDGQAELDAASRRALLAIGEGRPPGEWLDMARTLRDGGSLGLSAWALREILLRHEGDPGYGEVVSLARGHLAEVLCRDGQAEEAYQRLVELHEAGAPYPGQRLRLELLASTAEELGLVNQAADHYLARLDVLAEGDATRPETQRGAARTLMAAGRHQEALPIVQEVLERDPRRQRRHVPPGARPAGPRHGRRGGRDLAAPGRSHPGGGRGAQGRGRLAAL